MAYKSSRTTSGSAPKDCCPEQKHQNPGQHHNVLQHKTVVKKVSGGKGTSMTGGKSIGPSM